ncbi:hypothetical protein [Trichococcus collinsii]|uniref:hypothetical protein n=1 Tax=Trichococcus collinsii TaxID=157076 RepID=UPI000B34D5F3|nr:hypothetical protein [Trichococcus collinsii]
MRGDAEKPANSDLAGKNAGRSTEFPRRERVGRLSRGNLLLETRQNCFGGEKRLGTANWIADFADPVNYVERFHSDIYRYASIGE